MINNKTVLTFVFRREDKEPDNYSRVCSCHFRDGNKANCPEIFEWNRNKLFPVDEAEKKPKKARKSLQERQENQQNQVPEVPLDSQSPNPKHPVEIENIILQVELDCKTRELAQLKEEQCYKQSCYSASKLSEDVIKMETGLPNKRIFDIVVKYVEGCKHRIRYHHNWKVVALSIEEQVFLTLMKVRQNYTNLHLAQLYGLSISAISNIVLTFVPLLNKLLYKDSMLNVPSRLKNLTSLPGSFSLFGNCRMVIDCTDVKIATPSLMSDQKLTYSSYRGMNSFKLLLGVAPNAVITFVSKLYPGSVSDKEIVSDCGILDVFEPGDLVIADKGFLIQDLAPDGVAVNIPPFLNNGKFTESEIKVTKKIATCRIHVERANARLKDFKILSFIPPYLRCYCDELVQLCAALVNLRNPLIKEVNDTIVFE